MPLNSLNKPMEQNMFYLNIEVLLYTSIVFTLAS